MTDETRRETNALWFRSLMPLIAVALAVMVDTYQDPSPGPGDSFLPFDAQAVKSWWMFGDPITKEEWIGDLNFAAAAAYGFAGLTLVGRRRLRGIAITFVIAGILGVAAVAALVHLAVTDPASFSMGGDGLGPIFFAHTLAFAASAAAWWQMRRAAMA